MPTRLMAMAVPIRAGVIRTPTIAAMVEASEPDSSQMPSVSHAACRDTSVLNIAALGFLARG